MPFHATRYRWLLFILTLGAGGLTLYVLWNARLLRPMSDDYCRGSVAGWGLPAALAHWMTTWSADFTTNLVAIVTVGLPLVHLPWNVTSVVAFAAAALSVTLAVIGVLRASVVPTSQAGPWRRWWPLSWLALVPTLWWAFWWIPVAVGAAGDSTAFARAVTFWQTVNAAYVIPWGLLIAALFVLGSRRQATTPLVYAGLAAVGVLIGLSGLVFAVSTVVTLVAARLLMWIAHLPVSKTAMLRGVAIVVSIASGVLIGQLMPGTRARSLVQGATLDLTPNALYLWTFPTAIVDWLELLASSGLLVVFVAASLASSVMVRAGISVRRSELLAVSGILVLASLVVSIVSRASEAFIYPAYWHRIPVGLLLFIAAVCLGGASGGWVARASWRLLIGTTVGLAIAAPMIGLGAGWLVAEVQKRQPLWEAGPAPFETIADIEQGSGWAKCWVDLGEFRAIPDRLPPGFVVPESAPNPS